MEAGFGVFGECRRGWQADVRVAEVVDTSVDVGGEVVERGGDGAGGSEVGDWRGMGFPVCAGCVED